MSTYYKVMNVILITTWWYKRQTDYKLEISNKKFHKARYKLQKIHYVQVKF